MFPGLRLDRFVRRDRQQHQIHARGSRQHVADKPFVPRHIDKAESHAAFFQKSKTQIDGDAPLLFLRKPVRMRPRQRLNKRRLAVIDVPRRADDDALVGVHVRAGWCFDVTRDPDLRQTRMRRKAVGLDTQRFNQVHRFHIR